MYQSEIKQFIFEFEICIDDETVEMRIFQLLAFIH